MKIEELLERLQEGGLQGKKIGLVGSLGAGKTHLVRALIEALDPSALSEVGSPSFNLCNRYRVGELEVHHFDLYRIEEEEELDDLECYESLDDESVLTLIEWPNQFSSVLQQLDFIIKIEVLEGENRNYRIYELDEIDSIL